MLYDTLNNTAIILTDYLYNLHLKNYILKNLEMIKKTDKDLYEDVLRILEQIEKEDI
jgi:hypothetical protein